MAPSSLDGLFAQLWDAYVAITPQAHRVHALLGDLGESIHNDHVAFRTFDLDPIRLPRLAQPFLDAGYVETGTYRFEDKKLLAKSYSHPSGQQPRVFISELLTGELSADLQRVCRDLAARVDPTLPPERLLTEAPTWPAVDAETYERLLAESEYAAWVAAFGLRANHFTVDVNRLGRLTSIAAVNAFLKEHGFALNAAGGEIKGGPAELLEQSSTRASRVPWTFAGGVQREIPSCYYEFAYRYPDPATGRRFDGFVTQSADKIFESTNVR